MLRLIELQMLKKLLNNQKLDLKEISKFFGISYIQARNHIRCIDRFLQISMNSKLEKENDKYSIVNYGKINNYLENLPLITSERSVRIDYILIKLIIERRINLTEISKTLNVTKITIYTDIKFVKKILKNFNLSILSFKWKGTEIIGSEKDIFRFSIEFFTKILSLDFCDNNLYSSITNYKLGEYLKSYILNEQIEQFHFFIKKITFYLDYIPNFYQYNSLVASLIYSSVCNKSIKSLDIIKSNIPLKIFKKYEMIVYESQKINLVDLKNFDPLIYILCSSDKELFNSKNIYDTLINISLFINEIQDLFNMKIEFQEKFTINTLITTSIFKKRYVLSDYLFLNIENYDEKFVQFKIIINNYYSELYDEDIYQLYNYLIDIKNRNKSLKINLKNILLIDKSLNLWLGNKLKKLLIQNFDYLKISVQSYCNVININKTYDYIIYINIRPNLERENILKVCYMGEEHINLKKFEFLVSVKLIVIIPYIFLILDKIFDSFKLEIV